MTTNATRIPAAHCKAKSAVVGKEHRLALLHQQGLVRQLRALGGFLFLPDVADQLLQQPCQASGKVAEGEDDAVEDHEGNTPGEVFQRYQQQPGQIKGEEG